MDLDMFSTYHHPVFKPDNTKLDMVFRAMPKALLPRHRYSEETDARYPRLIDTDDFMRGMSPEQHVDLTDLCVPDMIVTVLDEYHPILLKALFDSTTFKYHWKMTPEDNVHLFFIERQSSTVRCGYIHREKDSPLLSNDEIFQYHIELSGRWRPESWTLSCFGPETRSEDPQVISRYGTIFALKALMGRRWLWPEKGLIWIDMDSNLRTSRMDD